jgi:hypothetical protein
VRGNVGTKRLNIVPCGLCGDVPNCWRLPVRYWSEGPELIPGARGVLASRNPKFMVWPCAE